MRGPKLLCTVVLALLAGGGPAAAWDRTGHLVVARIAWEEMTPRARERAAELLAAAPEDAGLRQLLPGDSQPLERRRAEHFQNAAYWPDIVRDGDFPERRDKYHHGDWHWINFFFEGGTGDGPARERTDLPPRGEILDRLRELVPSLSDTRYPAAKRAIHLAWVLHLVGDLHQPLHATARITPTEPDGDRGGNLFPLHGDSNLHWFWDSILRSSNSRWFFQSDDGYVRGIVESIVERHPRSGFGERVESEDYTAWARESFETSMASLYPADLERYRKPSRAYAREALRIAEERIALAGYRLGRLLEEQLGR